MFRLIFCLVLLFATLSGFAQRSLSVSVSLVPTAERVSYNRRMFYPNSEGQMVEPIYINDKYWWTGLQAGASVQYKYAPGWSVSLGIWYRQLAVRQTRLDGDGVTTLRSRVVRVPLLLNAYTSPDRLSPYFYFGALVDVPMQTRVIATRTDQPAQRLWLDTEPGPYFWLLAGAGVRYRLNKQYALVAQPVITYNIGRFGGIRTHNPSFEIGMQGQVSYSF